MASCEPRRGNCQHLFRQQFYDRTAYWCGSSRACFRARSFRLARRGESPASFVTLLFHSRVALSTTRRLSLRLSVDFSAFFCHGFEISVVMAAVAKVVVVYALFTFPLLVWRQSVRRELISTHLGLYDTDGELQSFRSFEKAVPCVAWGDFQHV